MNLDEGRQYNEKIYALYKQHGLAVHCSYFGSRLLPCTSYYFLGVGSMKEYTSTINLDLVKEYEDILEGKGSCGNNMDFYLSSEKRLRYKLNELHTDYYSNNEFFECFDRETLDILKPEAWDKLSKMSKSDMHYFVDTNDWNWLGDDFEDMESYLSFLEDHDLEVYFKCENIDEDYLYISKHLFVDQITEVANKLLRFVKLMNKEDVA